jgi:RND family efflux transporter MFP subunit
MKNKKMIHTFVSIAIIALGVGIFTLLSSKRVNPKQQRVEKLPTLVEVITVKPAQQTITVDAMGTVIPAKSITVFPEVSGKVINQSPELLPGGRFKSGQVMLRIDPQEYDYSIRLQQANVSQAKQQLAIERGLKVVAKEEWLLTPEENRPRGEAKSLALREIQYDSAQAALDAAIGNLEKAQMYKRRTVIRAPFNAMVTEEFVDRGQVVSPNSKIAGLVGTDTFWVRVSVAAHKLPMIDIPGVNSQHGSSVIIKNRLSDNMEIQRQGRVIKLLGELDPQGKMARLLIEIDDPLGSTTAPLLLGSYVELEIAGRQLQEVVSLPRRALRDQSRIWVKTPENKLEIRSVTVVWSQAEQVMVRGDLKAGEQVITSKITTPVNGLVVLSQTGDRS